MVSQSVLRTLSLVVLAAGVLASPTPQVPHLTRSILKSSHPAPKEFVKRGLAPREANIELKIGVKQSNREVLQKRLVEISTPGHADYGKHYTREALQALTAPSKLSMDSVAGWLESFGVRDWTQHAGDWIAIVVPVSVAEKMLGTQYSVYEDIKTGHQLLRTETYELPEGLHRHIDVIHPTNYFGNLHRQGSTIHSIGSSLGVNPPVPAAVGDCDTSLVSANCLRTLYKTIDYEPAATDKNKIGIAGYLDEWASNKDLSLFLKKYRTDADANTKFEIVKTNDGEYDEGNPGGEASLDAQTVVGIGYPTPVTYYSTDGSPPFIPDSGTPSNSNEPYLNFTSFQLALEDDQIPYVISTSYGDDEQTVPADYAVRVCDAFSQLAARGQTLFFSSGDSGVGSDGDCISNVDNSTRLFLPAFPASCPYVTAVGGTRNFEPETVVTWAGAGFSNLFETPDFQKDVVSSYLENVVKDQHDGLYNKTGRAYPDVSGQAVNYGIYVDGTLHPISGTSASAPAVAAVFGLLNDVQLAAGKKPLGWANPWIYGDAKGAFNDITSGSVEGCEIDKVFDSVEGWDAASGWGTPDFEKLKAALP